MVIDLVLSLPLTGVKPLDTDVAFEPAGGAMTRGLHVLRSRKVVVEIVLAGIALELGRLMACRVAVVVPGLPASREGLPTGTALEHV